MRHNLLMNAHPHAFESRFAGQTLDLSQWFPAYLPHWTGSDAAAARYRVDDGLSLLIESDQAAWRPPGDPWLRVSGLQTGHRSGPVGSTDGQGRHREGLRVVETNPELRLALPSGGRVEIRARANPDPNVMVALWLIGFEEQPAESGEICVMEIFGREIEAGGGLVGMGIHPWDDSRLIDDFEKVRVQTDLTEWHDYAIEWTAGHTSYFMDGVRVKSSEQAPTYPMQLMLAVFEFEPGGSYPKIFEVERVLAFEVPDSP